MAIELSEIAAGLPFAASIAMTTGISVLREGRRRTALNAAVHELRRPLQALALSLPPEPDAAGPSGSALRMAVSAVERLDREINRRPLETVTEHLPARRLVEAAVARWKPRTAASGRWLKLSWRAGEPALHGDEIELAQALDNLISNGFEHGLGPLEIRVAETQDVVRICVRDGGPSGRRAEDARRSRRRHGHGLRVVRRVAARHGGAFDLLVTSGGTEARLELPLARAAS